MWSMRSTVKRIMCSCHCEECSGRLPTAEWTTKGFRGFPILAVATVSCQRVATVNKIASSVCSSQ
jgi:hypothetical protein